MRRLIIFIVLSALVIAGGAFIRMRAAEKFDLATANLSSQMNNFFEVGRVGEGRGFSIPMFGGDEIVYLSPYKDEESLTAAFPGPLATELYQLSADDHLCPALVWIGENSVIAHSRLNLDLEADFELTRWIGIDSTDIFVSIYVDAEGQKAMKFGAVGIRETSPR